MELMIVAVPVILVLILFLCIKFNLENVVDSELEDVSDIYEEEKAESTWREVREKKRPYDGKQLMGDLFNQVFVFIASVFLVSSWIIGIVIVELAFLIPLSFLVGFFLLVILALIRTVMTSKESLIEKDDSTLKVWRCPECQVRLQVSDVKQILEGSPIQCPSCGTTLSSDSM